MTYWPNVHVHVEIRGFYERGRRYLCKVPEQPLIHGIDAQAHDECEKDGGGCRYVCS